MTVTRKMTHKAETAKGSVRKTSGRLTGNRRQRARGSREQATGNVKQAMDRIRDFFRR